MRRRTAYRGSVGKSEGNTSLGEPECSEGQIVKRIFKK